MNDLSGGGGGGAAGSGSESESERAIRSETTTSRDKECGKRGSQSVLEARDRSKARDIVARIA